MGKRPRRTNEDGSDRRLALAAIYLLVFKDSIDECLCVVFPCSLQPRRPERARHQMSGGRSSIEDHGLGPVNVEGRSGGRDWLFSNDSMLDSRSITGGFHQLTLTGASCHLVARLGE